MGTIRSINSQTGILGVELDHQGAQQKSRMISVNLADYNHLEHGYAATVYKAQGVTVDRTYLLTSRHYDAHSTYVALTRHRQSCDVFVSREAFANNKTLTETLKRNRAKDVTLDYTNMGAEFARQRAIFTEKPMSQGSFKQDKAPLTIEALLKHRMPFNRNSMPLRARLNKAIRYLPNGLKTAFAQNLNSKRTPLYVNISNTPKHFMPTS